jgi:hypothetical protein
VAICLDAGLAYCLRPPFCTGGSAQRIAYICDYALTQHCSPCGSLKQRGTWTTKSYEHQAQQAHSVSVLTDSV